MKYLDLSENPLTDLPPDVFNDTMVRTREIDLKMPGVFPCRIRLADERCHKIRIRIDYNIKTTEPEHTREQSIKNVKYGIDGAHGSIPSAWNSIDIFTLFFFLQILYIIVWPIFFNLLEI